MVERKPRLPHALQTTQSDGIRKPTRRGPQYMSVLQRCNGVGAMSRSGAFVDLCRTASVDVEPDHGVSLFFSSTSHA